ncbi:TMEM43 family protein [Roseibacillus persicicus]|uniref:TMEM43 family protein n=1 Tax=Roseibacillus persicicus TaxID=454148 RepID=UPI00280E67CF|nr:TMEM43 family protein [Roseibacillus persicicus]MDQ8191180.1 TMEM43 family protein [Roseibacillus persicicus]
MNVVSNLGWFGRIGRSFKGILVGVVMALVSVVLLVGNERNAVRDIRANREVGKEVIPIGNESVDPGKEGKLVHLNGPTLTNDLVENPEFGISENAIRLTWNSEIYQWDERSETSTDKKVGGGETTSTSYTYEKKWVPNAIDSSKFEEAGHENNSVQKFSSGQSQATNVTLGAFQLPETLINKITSSEPYPLQEVPADLVSETANVTDGVFYTGSPTAPEIGDERVTFALTQPGNVSVMGVQKGESFEPYRAKNGKIRFELNEGLLSATEMVQVLEQKAKFLRWALRIAGFVLMSIGFGLILKPLSVLADLVPFLGNLVGAATGIIGMLLAGGITLIIAAISWITFRPLIGVPLLIVALAALFFGIKKLTAKPANAPQTA